MWLRFWLSLAMCCFLSIVMSTYSPWFLVGAVVFGIYSYHVANEIEKHGA